MPECPISLIMPDVMTLKRWYLIHKWTSLICTIFLLLLCLTGLPLIFREEIALWLGHVVEPPSVESETQRANLDDIAADAAARRPGESIQFVSQDHEAPAWFVSLGATPNAADSSCLFMYDARTGAFLHEIPLRQGFMYVMLKLHVDLFADLPGTLFLGAMGLLFVVSVVSGVVVYGPFMRKLPFGTVRMDGSRRLAWLDLHNLLGIVTVLWVLVVGGTGVINTLARPIFAYWQQTELTEMTAPWRGQPIPSQFTSLQQAVATTKAAEPQKVVDFVAFPGTDFAGPHHYAVFLRGQTPLTTRLIEPVLIDVATGQIAASRTMPWYVTALLVSEPLHFGDYGGLPLKIVWALLDSITIVVLISGLYLWWKKRRMSVEQVLAEADPNGGMAVGMSPSLVSR